MRGGHRARMTAVALDHRRARRHLTAADPTMADLIRRAGPCRLGASRAADTVLPAAAGHRVAAALDQGRGDDLRPAVRAVPGRRPDADAAARPPRGDAARRGPQRQQDEVRARPGVTRPRRPARPDGARHRRRRHEALAALTAVLGIGTWTAEIFLLFQLHRPDILPVGDLGLLTAMQRVYRLRTRPTPARALKLAEAWRPHRLVAAWYLWRSLEI